MVLLVFSVLTFLPAFASYTPESKPIECKDGTVSKAARRQGACSGHGGIRE